MPNWSTFWVGDVYDRRTLLGPFCARRNIFSVGDLCPRTNFSWGPKKRGCQRGSTFWVGPCAVLVPKNKCLLVGGLVPKKNSLFVAFLVGVHK